jgi:hypothetical protein
MPKEPSRGDSSLLFPPKEPNLASTLDPTTENVNAV